MGQTKPQPCPVCNKQFEIGCSHVDCPNRKPLTANLPDDRSVQPISGGVIRVPIRYD